MKVLIINGHPDKMSFTSSIASALQRKYQGKLIHLADLKFNPVFTGFDKTIPLEDDLIQAQKDITEAKHIIITTPIWWSTYPALLKGFLDRVLLPDFAFSYKPGATFQDKLLKGRTAELYLLSDAPAWYRKYLLRDPAATSLKRDVLGFCGIKVKKIHRIGNVRNINAEERIKFIEKISWPRSHSNEASDIKEFR